MLRENPEIRAGLDERYRYILVDEYQDTNLAQYAIARALSIDYPNLAVTGDPDQSIYGWRGANLNNILNFEKDFPAVRVVRLEQNYRSTKRILRVADELISHNLRRKKKALFTENEAGEPVRLVTYPTNKDEAEMIAAEIAGEIAAGRRRARDFAIFYRTNALSRSFELALREAGVPYQMVNGVEFFQRKEIKDVLAYLQLVNNLHDEVALLRVINTPTRGIGKTTIERLGHFAQRQGISLLDAARGVKRVEAISARAARLVAEFVAIADRLFAGHARGPIEELLGLVLSETGYEAMLKGSGDEEDEERLANIQELLTVARDFDERHSGERCAPRGVPGGDGAGQRHRRVGDATRSRHADDAARLEGAGVSLRLPCRRGRGTAAARTQPQSGRAIGGGAAADVRRHHAGPAAVADQPGPVSRFPRRAEAGDSQFVSHGIAARRDGRPAAGSDAPGRGGRRDRRRHFTTCPNTTSRSSAATSRRRARR